MTNWGQDGGGLGSKTCRPRRLGRESRCRGGSRLTKVPAIALYAGDGRWCNLHFDQCRAWMRPSESGAEQAHGPPRTSCPLGRGSASPPSFGGKGGRTRGGPGEESPDRRKRTAPTTCSGKDVFRSLRGLTFEARNWRGRYKRFPPRGFRRRSGPPRGSAMPQQNTRPTLLTGFIDPWPARYPRAF